MIRGHLGGVAEVNNGEWGVKAYPGLLGGNASFERRDISGTSI